MILSSRHRTFKKNFETEFRANGLKLLLNHFVQEALANMMIGFMKTLKESPENPRQIEVRIKKLAEPMDVDAHTYP
jgi:hypothetical protein